MIVEYLIRFGAWFITWVLSWLPSLPVPSWYGSAASAFATLRDAVDGFGAFLPFGVLGAVLGTVLLVAAVSFGVKVARIVASFLTLGGGSAA